MVSDVCSSVCLSVCLSVNLSVNLCFASGLEVAGFIYMAMDNLAFLRPVNQYGYIRVNMAINKPIEGPD